MWADRDVREPRVDPPRPVRPPRPGKRVSSACASHARKTHLCLCHHGCLGGGARASASVLKCDQNAPDGCEGTY